MPTYPLRPMQRRLRSADITVGNLESTLSTDGSPTQGGDSFAADPRVSIGRRAAGFDALSLANNHAGDYGERALVQTVDRLAPLGAGRDGVDAFQFHPGRCDRGTDMVGTVGIAQALAQHDAGAVEAFDRECE